MNYAFIISAILVLLCYWRWRNLYYTRLAIEHRHAMFRLRDELRWWAIQGRIDKNGPAFDFLDTGLCFGIGKAERYNLYTFALMRYKAAQMDSQTRRKHNVDHLFENEPEAHEILKRFRRQMRDYFLAKHYFLNAFVRMSYGWQSLRDRVNAKADDLAGAFIANSNRKGNESFASGLPC